MNLIEGGFPAEQRPVAAKPEGVVAAIPSGAAAPAAAATAPDDTSRSWVPIRSLSPRHRQRIGAHLALLDERSRYLRFGFQATDSQMVRYVDTIDFEHDEAFGIFNRRLELIAMAHLAYRPADVPRGQAAAAEFGVSVLPQARRRGFGRRLFEHAMLHARNRGVTSIFIHALSENTAMLKIARDAGAIVERDGPECEAWLKLPPGSFASHLDQFLGDSAAELDYRLKHHTLHIENLFRRTSEGLTAWLAAGAAANIAAPPAASPPAPNRQEPVSRCWPTFPGSPQPSRRLSWPGSPCGSFHGGPGASRRCRPNGPCRPGRSSPPMSGASTGWCARPCRST